MIACADVAAALERGYPEHAVIGERELRRRERAARSPARERRAEAGRAIAAGCCTGPTWCSGPLGRRRGLPVAVEVELTIKAPRRLAEICRAWARSRRVAGVLYLAPAERRACARSGRSTRRRRASASSSCRSTRCRCGRGQDADGRRHSTEKHPKRAVGSRRGSIIEQRRAIDVLHHDQPRRARRPADTRPRAALAALGPQRLRACGSPATRAGETPTADPRERPNYFDVSVYGASAESVGRLHAARAAASASTGAWSGASGRPPTSSGARRSASSPTSCSSSTAPAAGQGEDDRRVRRRR